MQSLSTDLAIWRNTWSDGMAVAKQANTMLRGRIEASRVGV